MKLRVVNTRDGYYSIQRRYLGAWINTGWSFSTVQEAIDRMNVMSAQKFKRRVIDTNYKK